ncbi:MAG: EcsC family protein [Agathobacter sp.]|nr:EcsC family protein [Agathobacter sp.]
MRLFKSAIEKEWTKLEKEEYIFFDKALRKEDSKLNQFLSDKVPSGLQDTLDAAFAKAFYMVFEKGTDVIEKTYKKSEIEKDYQINDYTVKVKENRKNLKVFSKKAAGAGNTNLLISGVSGIGMGVLGIGIPDIVVFTSLMLRSVYEICLHYGYDYKDAEEKKFILFLIQGAVCHDTNLLRINEQLNLYIENGEFSKVVSLNDCVQETAKCLSKELLYMKFLQGIPLVGAVGGAYDVIYMKQVNKFAELKYRRRFLAGKRRGEI